MHRGSEIKVYTMKTMEFKAWMKSIERMSRNQRDKLRKRLEGKAHADEVIAMIEGGQDDKPACPKCKISLGKSQWLTALSLPSMQSHV